jgi:hypothetical protein
VSSIRVGRRKRQQVRVGAPDAALTANAGLAAVGELCDRLGVVEALDAAVGPIKQRDRGCGAGELLCGIAAAQLAGEDFLTCSATRPHQATPGTGWTGGATTRPAQTGTTSEHDWPATSRQPWSDNQWLLPY